MVMEHIVDRILRHHRFCMGNGHHMDYRMTPWKRNKLTVEHRQPILYHPFGNHTIWNHPTWDHPTWDRPTGDHPTGEGPTRDGLTWNHHMGRLVSDHLVSDRLRLGRSGTHIEGRRKCGCQRLPAAFMGGKGQAKDRTRMFRDISVILIATTLSQRISGDFASRSLSTTSSC